MRTVVWLILLFVAAVVAAAALGPNDGVVSIFYGGPRSFLLQGAFTVVDSLFRKRTGMTGSMIATLRKPVR